MLRIHFLLSTIALLFVGCAESSSPPVTTPTAGSTTVTANKPPAGEPLPESELTSDGQRSDELPAPDESLLPPEEFSEENSTDRMRRELGEAADAVSDWSAESKDKLVERAEQRLAELDKMIAQFEAKAVELSDDAKARWVEEKQRLEQRRSEFSEKLEQLKSSGGAAWKEMSKGIAEAWSKLKEASDAAASEFE